MDRFFAFTACIRSAKNGIHSIQRDGVPEIGVFIIIVIIIYFAHNTNKFSNMTVHEHQDRQGYEALTAAIETKYKSRKMTQYCESATKLQTDRPK